MYSVHSPNAPLPLFASPSPCMTLAEAHAQRWVMVETAVAAAAGVSDSDPIGDGHMDPKQQQQTKAKVDNELPLDDGTGFDALPIDDAAAVSVYADELPLNDGGCDEEEEEEDVPIDDGVMVVPFDDGVPIDDGVDAADASRGDDGSNDLPVDDGYCCVPDEPIDDGVFVPNLWISQEEMDAWNQAFFEETPLVLDPLFSEVDLFSLPSPAIDSDPPLKVPPLAPPRPPPTFMPAPRSVSKSRKVRKAKVVSAVPTAKPTKKKVSDAAPPSSSSGNARAKKARTEATGPDVRPETLRSLAGGATPLVRQWCDAIGVKLQTMPVGRGERVGPVRAGLELAEVERTVARIWAYMVESQRINLKRSRTLPVFASTFRGMMASIGGLAPDPVRALAAHDCSAAAGVCGLRICLPTSSMAGGCAKSTRVSARGGGDGEEDGGGDGLAPLHPLCSRCSQLLGTIRASVAACLFSLFVLTDETENVDAHLRGVAELLYWFACTGMYINRNFCYRDVQNWTCHLLARQFEGREGRVRSTAAEMPAAGSVLRGRTGERF